MYTLVKLSLRVVYPASYPDVLPELELEPIEGDLEPDETTKLTDQLRAVVSLVSLIDRLDQADDSREKRT